jgi:hypothetical protein
MTMEQLPAAHDDATLNIDLQPAPAALPQRPAEPGRAQSQMRAIHEGIARVEAEAKASCAAESAPTPKRAAARSAPR